MLKFLGDEDIPRPTGKVLRDRGYKVLDVRECGLRGEVHRLSYACRMQGRFFKELK